MRKLGFWSDTEGDQIRAINEAADELGRVQSNTNFLAQRADSLQRLATNQQAEIVRLKAALQAVCDLLVDLNLVDEQALGYRIDAALADANPAPDPRPPPRPFDIQPDPPAAERSTAHCSRCHRSVPAGDISFTDKGPMCDACVGALAAETGE
jgi:hypothetical protein